MRMMTKSTLAGAVALAVAQMANAGTAPYFIPLTKPEIVEPANSVDERNAPWSVPAGITQRNLLSLSKVEADVQQSIVRVPAGNQSSMFDMLAFDPTGNYIFIPHETPFGAGVSRYDVANDKSEILLMGDESGNAGFVNDTDFGAFDPARWTPNGTIIAGEEWAGTGRFVEICNPLGAAPANPVVTSLNAGNCETDANADWRVLDNLPLSAQEGIVFSEKHLNKVMYFVDEDNTGSIYKTVFTTAGKYNDGATTYVLSVDSFQDCATNGACDASKNWNDATNVMGERIGKATWIPITDANGAPLAGIQDPRENLLDGNGNVLDAGLASRLAADDVNGTPFGRPEDATVSVLAGDQFNNNRKYNQGNEAIFFTATSENSVYVIEETDLGPVVKLFVSRATPKNVGFEATTAELNAPDNLAIDALGNIYVIEDSPNTTTVGADGGDIWFVRDIDNDGVAESLDHFMSLQVNQSEATGMIFNPVDPTKFIVAVQHPASTDLNNVPDGFGDAIWEFDVSAVLPPACDAKGNGKGRSATFGNFYSFNNVTNKWVLNCVDDRHFNFLEQLEASEVAGDFPTP